MIDMLFYTTRYASVVSILVAGIDIFWQVIIKSYEKYPQTGKEKLSRRFIDLLSGALDSSKIEDPVKYLVMITDEFTQRQKCHFLQFIRKYIELFPHAVE